MRKAKKAKASPKRNAPKRTTATRTATPTEEFIETRMPREESWDPYALPTSEIPKGRDYQWIAVAILGQPVHPKTLERATRGWKPVPLKRHAKRFSHSVSPRHILIQGLQLYDRKAPKVGLTDANLAAIAMVKDHPASKTKGDGGRVFILSESFNAVSDYKRVRSDAKSIAVEVSIPVWLSAHLQDTASALKLSNEEYARRRVMLHLEGRIAGLLLPHGEAFELREIFLNEGQRNA